MHWTRPLRSVASAGDGLVDRLLCVVGAVLFSQLPEFMQQYLQRLGGHLDEARRQLEQFHDVATKAGLSFQQLVAKSLASGEPTVAKLGQVMRETAARVDALAAADAAIRHASVFARPLVFLRHLDLSIAGATWDIFKPAVPTTVEGMTYAAVGVLAVLAFYHGGVKYPARRLWRRRVARRELARSAPTTPGILPAGDLPPGQTTGEQNFPPC